MRLATIAWAAGLAAMLWGCLFTGPQPRRVAIETASYYGGVLDTYQVELQMVVFADQIAQYPKTYKAFQDAIDTWANVTPLHITTYTQGLDDPHPFFGPLVYSDKWKVVEVHIADIQSPAYGYQKMTSAVGIWEPDENRLLLDGDMLEQHPEAAYGVALHEMGHMLGLPHIVNLGESAFSGYIVVEKDAQSYVMYPSVVESEEGPKLSDLEVFLATNYIRHVMTLPGQLRKTHECHLTTD